MESHGEPPLAAERMGLEDEDVAYLVGRGGATRARLENFSGARLNIDRDSAAGRVLNTYFEGMPVLRWLDIVDKATGLPTNITGGGVLPTRVYAMMAVSTLVTAGTSVWNQQVIKGFAVPVNLQNSIMYFFGSIIATASYVHAASTHGGGGHGHGHGHHAAPKGFFEGYTTLAALLVLFQAFERAPPCVCIHNTRAPSHVHGMCIACAQVLFQAFHGLAVTLVYKYADAIVKNFANSAVMAILVLASVLFFGANTTLTSYLGVAGVLITTYAYMNIALKM